MSADNAHRTELYRSFLIEKLPDPLSRASPHVQIFDNYIPETRVRLRSVRVPETKEWTHSIQKRILADDGVRLQEIELNHAEYEHFKLFEGNEIRKNRYFHKFDGQGFDFEVYLGPLWGLNRARAQFASREEMETFTSPAFALAEITSQAFFDDANLVNCRFDDVRREVEVLIERSRSGGSLAAGE